MIKTDVSLKDYFIVSDNDDHKVTLPQIINEEMLSQGLDPINSLDVKEFWRSKGIEV